MVNKSLVWILIILLLIQFIGCYSYNAINIAETERIEKGEKFKVTTFDSTVYYITNVEILETMVKGKEKVVKDNLVYPERVVKIRFEDIKELEVEEIDIESPILIILGVCGVAMIAFAVILTATSPR